MWDLIRFVLDSLRNVYWVAINKPRISCSKVSSYYPAYWGPDCIWNDDGKEIASGIEIIVFVSFLLANEGPVETSIKDIYVEVVDGKRKGRLEYRPDMKGKSPVINKIQDIQIGPRKTWGPYTLRFHGSIWGMDKTSKHTKARLIVEPVAQRRVEKKINLPFKE